MRQLHSVIVVLLLLVGCSRAPAPTTPPPTATTPVAAPSTTATPVPPTTTPTSTATATATPEPTIPATATATATPEPTIAPTATPRPTPTATSASADQAFDSGGLGLSQPVWDAAHVLTGDDILGTIYDEHYIVSFRDGNVHYIERQWNTETAVSAEEVVREGEQLIPSDSQLVESYRPEGQSESTVRLYVSASLASRFGEGAWSGAAPGSLTIQYNEYEFGVTRLIIGLGNTPQGAWRASN